MAKTRMRLPERLQADRLCPDFFGAWHLFGAYHPLLSAHHHAGHCLDCPWHLEFDGPIERRMIMQIVVVKAPKMLRGILRVMFKMNRPN